MPKRDDHDHDDEDGIEESATDRDYLMARAASALASLETAKQSLVEFLVHCNLPDDDEKGKERTELVDNALESASHAVRAVEDLDTFLQEVDTETFELGEPWEDGDDEAKDDDKNESKPRRGRK